MGEKEKCIHSFGVEPEGRGHLGDLGVDGRIILRRIFMKWDEGILIGPIWFRVGTCDGNL
jgi:hypothetical protein